MCQTPIVEGRDLSARNIKRVISSKSAGLKRTSWGLGRGFGMHSKKAQRQMIKRCDGQNGVVVAVIDTGIDRNHKDLSSSLWVNRGEIRGNGKDDDRNGYIDDVNGWDFSKKSGKITDSNGHGTHVSGIIGATGQSNEGYAGVCPGVKIMSIRYYSQGASGAQNLKNSIKAFWYAINMKKRDRSIKKMIINYSGGGPQHSVAEFKAMKAAEKEGILVVAAAGNEYSNGDSKHYYPAAYKLKNIISVAGIDAHGSKVSSSNYGIKTVHVAAPGDKIFSTMPGNNYGYLTGTSQATAFVSGLAAMIWSERSKTHYLTVRNIIEKSMIFNKKLKGLVKNSGQIYAPKAISYVHALMKLKQKKNKKKMFVSKKKFRNKASTKKNKRTWTRF